MATRRRVDLTDGIAYETCDPIGSEESQRALEEIVRAAARRMRREQTMIDPTTIARVCHEANRALQTAQADPTIPVAAPWDECGEEMRLSAVSGVQGVLDGNTPEQSHEGWVRFKVEHGWTLGPVKDEEKRQHPLLIPYDQLPESQKIKDSLFVGICRALAVPQSV